MKQSSSECVVPENQVLHGDNRCLLQDHVPDACVDLVYLDPPFHSGRAYHLNPKKAAQALDKAALDSGIAATCAFDDVWSWNDCRENDFSHCQASEVLALQAWLKVFRQTLGESSLLAYLVMMAARLVELHRVLKPTGSLYLHCDPSASHYLKILLDALFGPAQFRNEIIWHYSGWNARLKNAFNTRHDVILFYAKDASQQLFEGYAEPWTSEAEYVRLRKQKVRHDEAGQAYVLSDGGNGERVKRYLAEAMAYGKPVDDVWDLPRLNNSAKEVLGYPTQKPLALLQRILTASTRPGDLVLDPFCGSGTTLHAAQSLQRRWLGMDCSETAVKLSRKRLETSK